MRTVLRTVITVILLTIVLRTLGPWWRCSSAPTIVPEAEHKADATTKNQEPTTTPKPRNQNKPLNILFLMADDLRPQLKKAYGKTFMHTPHLDAFTDTALVFDWAYTNYAICSASRNSLLSGRVPDKTRVWNFLNDFRETLSATALTLPQFFRQHGYVAVGHGKLYHPGRPANNDLPYSWDAYPSGSTNSDCTGSPHPDEEEKASHGGGNFCPDAESTPEQFSDVNVTQVAIETIQNITAAAARSGQPWFIGLGWHCMCSLPINSVHVLFVFPYICMVLHLCVFCCSVVVDSIYHLVLVVSSSTHVSAFYSLCLHITFCTWG